jgi:hypothetical protein
MLIAIIALEIVALTGLILNFAITASLKGELEEFIGFLTGRMDEPAPPMTTGKMPDWAPEVVANLEIPDGLRDTITPTKPGKR